MTQNWPQFYVITDIYIYIYIYLYIYIYIYICGVFKCVVSLGKMKSHLLSIFAISIVSHLVSIFEIKFCLQASKQTNQPTKQTPYREDKSLCSAAGATKNTREI